LVQLDIPEPPKFSPQGEFIPPHKGTVQTVEDKHVEVVVAPSGDVQVYAYEQDGLEIPVTEINLTQINVIIEGKPCLVTLRPDLWGGYFIGRVSGPRVVAKARVEIAFPEPVVIHKRPIVVVAFPKVEVRPAVVLYRPHDRGNHYGQYKKGYEAGVP